MLKRLKTKLAALWHKLVNFLTTKERKLIMTLFARVEAIEAKIAAEVTPVDPTAAIAVAIAPVEAKVDALAELVGTPTPPAA